MKWMWQSSIARSIIGAFLAFMIPVLLFSIVMNNRSIGTARMEIAKSYQNSISLLTRQIDDRVSALAKVVNSLFNDTNILYLNYKDDESASRLFAYASLLDQLKFYSNASLLQGEIRLYLQNKGRSFSSANGYSLITAKDRSDVLEQNPAWNNHWRMSEDGLEFVRNPAANGSGKGIVAMARIERWELLRFLNNLNAAEPGGNLFLTDTEGSWLFAQDGPLADKDKLFQRLTDSGASEGWFIFTSGGTDYRVIYGKSSSSGLIVGTYFSDEYAMRTISASAWRMAVFSAMTGLLAVLFAWIVYSRLLRPFRELTEGMRKFGKGDFGTRLGWTPQTDFRLLFRHFNKMAGDTERLINEVYVERLNNQETRLKLLQSRINPHFLYNCLNFIYQMSMGENHEGAAKMASYLGKYFRDLAKGYKETLSLREECDNIANLLEIQNLRFGGRIGYRFDIPDELKEYRVPSLIVQPLAENAVLHGLPSDGSPLFVLIKARVAEDGSFEIVVEDNGRGMTESRLNEIVESFRTFESSGSPGASAPSSPSSSIGLHNIYWRLKLNYGDRAELRLEHAEAGGVRATLSFGPAKVEKEER